MFHNFESELLYISFFSYDRKKHCISFETLLINSMLDLAHLDSDVFLNGNRTRNLNNIAQNTIVQYYMSF